MAILPLPMHDRARWAAKASLAAEAQGKFWEYHDALFAGRALDHASLEKIAADLALDLPKFRAAMESDAAERRIAEDVVEAHRLEVRGTPTDEELGRRPPPAQLLWPPLRLGSDATQDRVRAERR